jgi:hypothetical protein
LKRIVSMILFSWRDRGRDFAALYSPGAEKGARRDAVRPMAGRSSGRDGIGVAGAGLSPQSVTSW